MPWRSAVNVTAQRHCLIAITLSAMRHCLSATTSAPQSLFMLNDAASINAAHGLESALNNNHKRNAAKLNTVYHALYTRSPSDNESKWALAYLRQTDKPWTLYHVLLCANEFLHVE